VEIGLMFQPLVPPGSNIAYTYQRVLETITLGDSLGFTEAWVGEHHSGGWENVPMPELLLAAAGERTKRIKLGTGVILLPVHNPVLVAERMAMLDQLTFGRAQMAVGPTVLGTDRIMFGIDHATNYERTNEALELILALYTTDGPLTFNGKYYHVDGVELQIKPFQRPHMPIAMPGSSSGNGFRQCGRLGLIPMSPWTYSAKQLRPHWDVVVQAAAENGRPDPDRSIWRVGRTIHVAETDKQAWDDIRVRARHIYEHYYINLAGFGVVLEKDMKMDLDNWTVEELGEKSDWIVGSPDTCRDKLAQFYDEIGGFGTVLMIGDYPTTVDKVHRSMELFVRDVLPHFQEQSTWTKRSEQWSIDAKGTQPQIPRSATFSAAN